MFNDQVGTAVDQLAGLFGEVVGIVINLSNFGEVIGRMVQRVGAWVGTAGSLVGRFVEWTCTTFGHSLQFLADQVVAVCNWLRTTIRLPAVDAALEALIGVWRTIAESAEQLLTSGRGAADLAADAINLLVNVVLAVGRGVKVLLLSVLELLGRAVALLIDAAGHVLDLEAIRHAITPWVQALGDYVVSHAPRARDVGVALDWGLGKLCEQVYMVILEKLSALERAAAHPAGWFRSVFDPSAGMISAGVTGLLPRLDDISRVVAPSDPSIQVFRDATGSMGDFVRKWQTGIANAEMVSKIVDTLVLMGEVVLMAASAFFSMGLAPAALGPAMTAFEISLGKARILFVHLPLMVGTLLGGYYILHSYGLGTLALPRGATP
jgi:hypothetical protein